MKLSLRLVLIGLLGFCMWSEVAAQDRPDPNTPQGENFGVPEGWEVRLDRPADDIIIGDKPDSSDIYFVNMTPGWHITTGPAGIFYHPAHTAEGTFSVETEMHYFDPGDRNREAYGLFWAGKNLDAEDQSYYYFLVRNTGEFLIKKRTGAETELIQNWTPSDAVAVYEDTEESSVRNVLSVDVREGQTLFSINNEQVASIENTEMDNNGIFGLRVNHMINLHISNLGLVSE